MAPFEGPWEEGSAIRQARMTLDDIASSYKQKSQSIKTEAWQEGAMEILRNAF